MVDLIISILDRKKYGTREILFALLSKTKSLEIKDVITLSNFPIYKKG